MFLLQVDIHASNKEKAGINFPAFSLFEGVVLFPHIEVAFFVT